MEIFGGFMVMMSILSLFMALVWLVMPFVVFAIKGKLDRTLELTEKLETRMKDIESQLAEINVSIKDNSRFVTQNQPEINAAD